LRTYLGDKEERIIKTVETQGLRLNCTVLSFADRAFLGRRSILVRIKDELERRRLLTLVGPEGMGKTELAMEFSKQFGPSYTGGAFIVLTASPILGETEEGSKDISMRPAFVRLGEDILQRTFSSSSEAIAAVQRWLSGHGGWLLLVDDVDNESELNRYFPSEVRRNGHVLVTSRNAEWGNFLEVPPLDEEDAVELLLPAAVNITQDELRLAHDLANLLGRIPRSLIAVRECIARNGDTLSGLVVEYSRDRGPKVVKSLRSLLETVLRRDDEGTWLLMLLAYLAPEHIPLSLFRDWLTLVPNINRERLGRAPRALRDIVEELTQCGIVSVQRPGFISINPFVQRLIRGISDDSTSWLLTALRLVDRNFTNQDELLAHAVTVGTKAEVMAVEGGEAKLRSTLWKKIAACLLSQGAKEELLSSMNGVLQMLKKAGGEFALDVPLNRFGAILRDRGHREEAAKYFEQARAITNRPEYSRIWDDIQRMP
jgi:hypothetical protein